LDRREDNRFLPRIVFDAGGSALGEVPRGFQRTADGGTEPGNPDDPEKRSASCPAQPWRRMPLIRCHRQAPRRGSGSLPARFAPGIRAFAFRAHKQLHKAPQHVTSNKNKTKSRICTANSRPGKTHQVKLNGALDTAASESPAS
jgi:hypothetical protein